MPVAAVRKDPDALTMTIVSEFDASADRLRGIEEGFTASIGQIDAVLADDAGTRL